MNGPQGVMIKAIAKPQPLQSKKPKALPSFQMLLMKYSNIQKFKSHLVLVK